MTKLHFLQMLATGTGYYVLLVVLLGAIWLSYEQGKERWTQRRESRRREEAIARINRRFAADNLADDVMRKLHEVEARYLSSRECWGGPLDGERRDYPASMVGGSYVLCVDHLRYEWRERREKQRA